MADPHADAAPAPPPMGGLATQDLGGRVAVVTGASAGIGRACAAALAERGANVALVARRGDRLEELASWIAQRGYPKTAIVAQDVTAPGAAAEVTEMVEATFGRLDILVNCAGGSRTLPLGAADSQWYEAMELNFHSVRRLGEAVVPLMRRGGYGRIINITGTSEPRRSKVYGDLETLSFINAANSAKAAVHAWAKGLSREIGASGITVNSIAPGVVASEQVSRIYATDADKRNLLGDMIPLGRLGDPFELAGLVAFLSSEAGSYISGEVIHVDGGMRRFAF